MPISPGNSSVNVPRASLVEWMPLIRQDRRGTADRAARAFMTR
jgi:hypothetical protein